MYHETGQGAEKSPKNPIQWLYTCGYSSKAKSIRCSSGSGWRIKSIQSLSDPCILLHKTGNKKVDEASKNMAKNFGIEYVVEYKEEKGGLTREATERGIPTILPEAGGEGKVEKSSESTKPLYLRISTKVEAGQN